MDYKITPMFPFKVIGFQKEFDNETAYTEIPKFWDDIGGGKFRYLVAGKYTGGSVPEGMVVYEFPRSDWAVFNCIGPIPEALQSMNTRIFREWLPGNPD